jgi:hypothetical protein
MMLATYGGRIIFGAAVGILVVEGEKKKKKKKWEERREKPAP